MGFKEDKLNFSRAIESAQVTMDLSWYKKVIIPKILENKYRYQELAAEIGCPVAMGPLVHLRENGADIGKFQAYLGNGQPISKVTTIVPKGRGPFRTWQAGAIDAFRLQALDEVEHWSLERMLYELERYNGFGYRTRNINTPYVWAGTNLYKKGKFVADGKFDANAVDKNPGCYAFYLALVEADPSFKIGLEVPTDKEPQLPEKKETIFDIIIGLLKGIINVIVGYKSESSKAKDEEPLNEELPTVEAPAKTMNRNKAVLLFASGEIGIKEIPGSGSNKQVEKYLDHGEVDNDSPYRDETPWCAGFVAYILEANPFIPMGSTNSLMARSYERWGVSTLSDPLPGDIATRYRGVKSKGFGHVHIFIGWHVEGKSYYGLGGNQNDEVNVSIYSVDKLTDIRRSSKIKELSTAEINELHEIAKQIIDGKKVEAGGKVV